MLSMNPLGTERTSYKKEPVIQRHDEAVQCSVNELFAHVGDPLPSVFVPTPTIQYSSIKPDRLGFTGGSIKDIKRFVRKFEPCL